ncbi:helix-turn-helix transcriptional regulator [Actinomadura alba]|uniref:AAA family ATPase n=1 Tax=Actinomadura alba TaxID=406431 RepID=A0ABR7LLI3_9ACTN|nr:LuxR family transcriptional regulator [Actinomadura alba]MBC6465464.1 AAA family ATPase [Actinomadura alba]
MRSRRPSALSGADGMPAATGDPAVLRGRDHELETLGALLDRTRNGAGGALLIVAEPGLGRSALLEAVVRRAGSGFRTLGTRGIRPERAVPFAGLHRLLRPVAERIRRLPASQADALAPVVGGLRERPADSLTLYAAVGGLLAEAARGGPVLCWVDDVQRLDRVSAEALAFTARRLADEPVVMVFSAGSDLPGATWPECFADVPGLALTGLDEPSGHRVLEDRTGGDLPAELAGELLEIACGRPLALVELAESLTPEQLSGDAPSPRALPACSRLRAVYRRRYLRLPRAARRLTLMAVADDRLDLDTLARAAARAGVDLRALEPARAAGLVRLDGQAVEVPDQLIRSCLYADAAPAERHAAHAALATVLDREWERSRRSWHLAAVAGEPDGRLADELATAALAARRAGHLAESSRAWQRAAALSRTREARAERLIAAASDAWTAGRSRRAHALLRQARPLTGTGELLGLAGLLRGEIELRDGIPAIGGRMLVEAADRLADVDRVLAITALARAGEAVRITGDRRSCLAIAERAAALGGTGESPLVTLMLHHIAGMAATFQGRHADAAARLRRVIEYADLTEDCAAKTWASLAALTLGDDQRAQDLATQAVAAAREHGVVAPVPWALWALAQAELSLGRYPAALAAALEGLRLSRVAGQANCAMDHVATITLIAAFQGDGETVARHLGEISDEVNRRGLARADAMSSWALACLDLADDRPADAAGRLARMAAGGPVHSVVRVLATPHFVEAAVRCGRGASSARALRLFELWAEGTRNPTRRALAQRCRALLADHAGRAGGDGDGDGRDGGGGGDDGGADDGRAGDGTVEAHFGAALRLHRHGDSAFEMARTELLYGHWLRRRRRPSAAREHLRNALLIFERYDAGRWVERARAELRAAGDTVPTGALDDARGLAVLTAQQAQIARLVAEGSTNREIAARLDLSHRTVDHHLRNVFTRLGIRSRVELARLLR